MARKYRHECERCGLTAELERVGRFSDDSFLELHHDYFDLEWQLRQAQARRHLAETRLELAIERIEALKAIVNELLDEKAGVPF